MDRLLRWLEPPIHILMWVGLLAGFMMMAHITADVAGKVFRSPITGTTEIASGYYMIAVAYLPWAWIARNDDHIAVELFTRAIPPAVMEWLELGIKLLTAFYVAIFVWQTWNRGVQQYGLGESLQVGGGYWIVWPSRFILPVAGALMVIYLIVRVGRDLSNMIRK